MNEKRPLTDTALVPGVGRIPYPAYRGDEPYIFLSYAHKNAQAVHQQIKLLNELGYHVWYDEGISPGNEWTDEIAEALEKCAFFLVFLTEDSAASENVQNEINFALDERKPFLAVHLEETELKGGLKLQIGTRQAILRYTMSQEEYVYKLTSCFERMGLKKSGGAAPQGSAPVPAPQKKRYLLPFLFAGLAVCAALFFLLGRGTGTPPSPAITPTPLPAGAAQPGKKTEDGFLYTLYTDHVEITGYDVNQERLTVPAAIEGLPVTAISASTNLFVDQTSLISVTLPDSITSIGVYAFANSKSLTSVSLPKGLKEIGDGAFSNCISLTSLSLPEGLEKIGTSAFLECYNLNLASLPDSLVKISDYAFYYCQSMAHAVLPAGLQELRPGAFGLCTGLKDISIPAGIAEIPGYLCHGCTALEKVDIQGQPTAIGDWAFYSCTALESFTIPDSVTSIGEYAFFGCSSLTGLNLPPQIAHLGSSALASCTQIKSLQLPEGVTALSDRVLQGCVRLSKVILPAGLTQIGEAAFDGCSTLSSVQFGGTQAQWQSIAIGGENEPLTQASIHYTE